MPFNIAAIVGGIFLTIIFVICLVEAIAPYWCWKTFESWKATSEPSKVYFTTRRITAIVALIIVAAFALFPSVIYLLNK